MNRRITAIIPSRYGSSRFPGKSLALIAGKPMICRVYERVSETKELDDVYVATDDIRISDAVTSAGGKAIMTSPNHRCGTERVAECAEILHLSDDDIVLNIQGDEPLIRPEMISDLIRCFDDPEVQMATLKKEISQSEKLDNSNVVKVVTDLNGDALYFSRFALPFSRGGDETKYWRHIGVYGYRKSFLMRLSALPQTELEKSESLEQLRALEYGFKIRVGVTRWDTVGVDTPGQLKEAERIINSGWLCSHTDMDLDVARVLFNKEIDALKRTRDSLDGTFNELLSLLLSCRGKIITMGLGKSGHVARKIAATMSSLGSPAFFLDPSDALHGDLGVVSEDDAVLMISHSGEAEELLQAIPVLQEDHVVITSITGCAGSSIAKASEIAVVLPDVEEACALGLAPTSSTTATLCYGDVLAVLMSIKKGFAEDDFRRLHPSGALSGKK